MAVPVYPRLGTTYPDANGVPITSAGALVDESQYISNALDSGYLLSDDPLDVFEPDDRTDLAGDAPADAQYLTLATNATLTTERVLTAGTNITLTDGGAGSTLTINATATAGSADIFYGQTAGTQVLPTGVLTVVQWTEALDPNNLFTANVYTTPAAGRYLISVELNIATTVEATVLVRITAGGSTATNIGGAKVSGGTRSVASSTVILSLGSGIAVGVSAQQNSGVDATIGSGGYTGFFTVQRLS
jgi:hypothetical protein